MFAKTFSPHISPLYLRIGTAIREAPRGASPESNRDERAFVDRKQPTQASNGFPNKRKGLFSPLIQGRLHDTTDAPGK
jgi:hypothetical protein